MKKLPSPLHGAPTVFARPAQGTRTLVGRCTGKWRIGAGARCLIGEATGNRGRLGRCVMAFCAGALLVFGASSARASDGDTARTAASRPHRPCRPAAAFALGLVVPGGGQFYVGDLSGGIEAVATDVVLFEALRRSGSSARGIAFFLGAVHFVEGLFAAQSCRTASGASSPEEYSAPYRRPVEAHQGRRPAVAGGWRIGVSMALRIAS